MRRNALLWPLAVLALSGCGQESARFEGRTREEWTVTLLDPAQAATLRRRAAEALGVLAREAPGEVAATLADVRRSTTDEELRRLTTVALGGAGRPALPALLEALTDASPRVVETALAVLGGLGPKALEAAPSMAALLASGEAGVATQAQLALARLGPRAAGSLAPYLDHADADVRVNALMALTRAAPEEPGTAQRLRQALADSDYVVRRRAAEGLMRTVARDPASVAALERALDDVNPFVVAASARALGEAGERAVALLPRLRLLLHSEHGPVRAATAEGLSVLGPLAKEALPDVQAALEREAGSAGVELLMARWRLSGEAGPTLDGLRPLVRRGQGEECLRATHALARMGPAAEPAVPDLVEALGRRDQRVLAIEALAAIGRAAQAARGALEGLATDPDPYTRSRAAHALTCLGAGPEERR